jgi:hypothetical protein
MGPSFSITAFDGSKKINWFGADLNGWLITMLLSTVIVLLLVMVASQSPTVVRIESLIPSDYAMPIIMGISGLIAFIIVFPLRLNVTVTGERRKYGYLRRWPSAVES